MSELSAEAKALLREASAAFEPDAAQLEAAGRQLTARLGTPSGPGPRITDAHSVADSGSLLGAKLLKATIALASACLIGALGYAALSAVPSTPGSSLSPSAALVLPVAPAVEPPLAATEPSSKPIDAAPPDVHVRMRKPERRTARPLAMSADRHAVPAATPQSAASVQSSPSSARDPDSLARETALIRAARSALKRGESALCLRYLAQHALSFPDGVLREERLATEVLALCAQGKRVAAQAALQRFVLAAPESPYTTQLARTCGAGR